MINSCLLLVVALSPLALPDEYFTHRAILERRIKFEYIDHQVKLDTMTVSDDERARRGEREALQIRIAIKNGTSTAFQLSTLPSIIVEYDDYDLSDDVPVYRKNGFASAAIAPRFVRAVGRADRTVDPGTEGTAYYFLSPSRGKTIRRLAFVLDERVEPGERDRFGRYNRPAHILYVKR